ncbi:amidophosphoribosyltransferase [Pyramidobacter piscolens]|uniref:Amidophosphoribosyltransferase n=2 Tax=Pyramidobacter piscolens TaxID=638849 RepID=A0ABM9ZWX7_9BACT|nr:amidophosphoribosyltransferase [Pyramidobacter piscolens]EFB91470.1 putative amidophosphoribosyltransferase [Pyramidobacter piscolens W5455]BDF77259.1 amidophosphoribosyltransferase [Pyramidobacter piscolens]
MGGFFAAALREDCVFDLFFGTDYHSHLGTRRAGLAVYGKKGFDRAIHNIENSPFRTKFEKEANAMQGTMGIGCISDYDPQPLVVRSHHGTYALTTVGKVNNKDRLLDVIMKNTGIHFFEMASGDINSTELVATLINQKDSLVEGIQYAQEMIDGSMTLLVLSADGIYCARDRFGRTPLTIGLKDEGFCASFEPFAYLNLGYRDYKELGPGEIDLMTPEGVTTLVPPGEKMSICTFLWVYYGYPSSHYEGVSVEQMRYNCGRMLARRDGMSRERIDTVAGVPDSGIAHAIGYANESGVPFSRPLIKYTPTWPRSFIPTIQSKRDMIAKMKLIPVRELIERQRLLLIDDSIVRGTQLRKTTEFLFRTGAREVHARPACPPIMFGCKYINFSRSNSDMELIARRIVSKLEGHEPERAVLDEYCDPESERYAAMLEGIRRQMGFSSLKFNRLDDMLAAVGVEPCKLCTYCWNGRE